MKSKTFFKKTLSVVMAALVSASTVFPVYAEDLTNDTETSAELETEAGSTEEVSAVPDEAKYYMLILPKEDNITYTYDAEYKDADLSEEKFDVLLYEEGEHVQVTVDTDAEYQLIDADTQEKFLDSSQVKDHKLEFDMPEKDLFLAEAAEETETVAETETVVETEPETVEETEPVTETEIVTEQTESETEPASESETETESEKETEHFLEKEEGVENLDASAFSSMRLIVLSSDSSTVVDREHLIGTYDNIYLLQYKTTEQTMNAYAYYQKHAEAVEPDTVVSAASDENAEESQNETTEAESSADETAAPETTVSDETEVLETEKPSVPEAAVADVENPIATLSGEADSPVAQGTDRVIALIDTGAEGANVIDQVSMIDDKLVGNGHADEMVSAITSMNPDAKILSIRALGDDNTGTTASIIAAMEYAINQNVSFINLSLYAPRTLANAVLSSEIEKAVSAGIEVVGAAGNDNADAVNYMPGCVGNAWIIGACDENGTKIESSNYGSTVDYNVVSGSTSEAAAKFSGYISANGTENIKSAVIFTSDSVSTDDAEKEPSDSDVDFKVAVSVPGVGKVTLVMDKKKKLYPPGKLCSDPDNDNFTRRFEVTYVNSKGKTVTKKGYCLQGFAGWPDDGKYSGSKVEALESGKKDKTLAKALFYLHGGLAWGKTIEYSDGSGSVNLKNVLTKAGCSTADEYFAMSHYILCYIYNGANGKWNYNGKYSPVLNSKGVSTVQDVVAKLKKMDFPNTEFSSESVKGNTDFVTPSITYKTLDENIADVTLPSGVTLVNETTGKSFTGSGSIAGGDKFHFVGDPQVVSGKTHNLTFDTTFSADYQAYAIHTSGQDVGFSYFGNNTLKLSVSWEDSGNVSLKKVSTVSGLGSQYSLEGAKYEVKNAGGQVVGTLTTNEKGISNTISNLPAGKYTAKEIYAPKGFELDSNEYPITISGGQTGIFN